MDAHPLEEIQHLIKYIWTREKGYHDPINMHGDANNRLELPISEHDQQIPVAGAGLLKLLVNLHDNAFLRMLRSYAYFASAPVPFTCILAYARLAWIYWDLGVSVPSTS